MYSFKNFNIVFIVQPWVLPYGLSITLKKAILELSQPQSQNQKYLISAMLYLEVTLDNGKLFEIKSGFKNNQVVIRAIWKWNSSQYCSQAHNTEMQIFFKNSIQHSGAGTIVKWSKPLRHQHLYIYLYSMHVVCKTAGKISIDHLPLDFLSERKLMT